MPNDTEASTGTIPLRTYQQLESIEKEFLQIYLMQLVKVSQSRAKAIVKTILAKIAKITLATINPPAFETPIVQPGQ